MAVPACLANWYKRVLMINKHILIGLTALLATPALAATQLNVVGLFSGKAVVVINKVDPSVKTIMHRV